MTPSDFVYLLSLCTTHRAVELVLAMPVYPLMLLEFPALSRMEAFSREKFQNPNLLSPVNEQPFCDMWDEADDVYYDDPDDYRARCAEQGLPLSIWKDGSMVVLSTTTACACQTPALLRHHAQ